MEVYWLEQSDSGVPFGEEWLSGSERVRLDRLHIPKRRADWRLGRWTAKCAVAAYCRIPCVPSALRAIEIRPAPSGAPRVFINGAPAALALSLSHSRCAALCAIAPAGSRLGCDLEAVEPRSPAFVADYFTCREQILLSRAPAAARDLAVTLLWSAKESVLKALHCGLRSDTRAVEAAAEQPLERLDEEWHRISATHIDGQVFSGWWRQSHGLIRTAIADPPPLRPIRLLPPAL